MEQLINIVGISTSFPKTKKNLHQLDYLSAKEKEILLNLGFENFFEGSLDCDGVDLALDSAKKLFKKSEVSSDNIQLFITSIGGNHRFFTDWPVDSYLQIQLGLPKNCLSMPFVSQCSSLARAIGLASLIMNSDSKINNCLISSGFVLGAPFLDRNAFVGEMGIQQEIGLLIGAGGVSIILSKEFGNIELVASSIGLSCAKEREGWNYPLQWQRRFFHENGKIFGGKPNWGWRRTDESNFEALSPFIEILDDLVVELGQVVKNKRISKLILGHCPYPDRLELIEKLRNSTGIEIEVRNEMYNEYAHMGPCDPGVFLKEQLNKPYSVRENICFLSIGQGWSGSYVIARKNESQKK